MDLVELYNKGYYNNSAVNLPSAHINDIQQWLIEAGKGTSCPPVFFSTCLQLFEDFSGHIIAEPFSGEDTIVLVTFDHIYFEEKDSGVTESKQEKKSIDWDAFDWWLFEQYGGLIVTNDVGFDRNLHETTEDPEDIDYRDVTGLAESPWYPWFGGECPVPDQVRVKFVCRDGHIGRMPSYELYWGHRNKPDDIIAFKITEQDV